MTNGLTETLYLLFEKQNVCYLRAAPELRELGGDSQIG